MFLSWGSCHSLDRKSTILVPKLVIVLQEMPELRGESAWEAHALFQKRGKRQATPNHKGVHLRQRNKKFAARLCLPGRKRQKLDLGEYNTHDAAARAYQVGAFYYKKSLDSTCVGDQSFLDSLPSVPDHLSEAEKLIWVRERARQSAACFNTLERLERSTTKSLLNESGCGSLEAFHALDRQKLKAATSHIPKEEIPGIKRRKFVETRSPNVELQPGRNSNAFNNQVPIANHQAVPQIKMTDSILFASCELRKQGWECTLKLRTPGSDEAGVLYSVPQGHYPVPTRVMTDMIIKSFYELREQGWEVHLEPRKCDNIEVCYFLRDH